MLGTGSYATRQDIAIIVRKERLDNKKGETKPLYVGKSSRQTY